MTFGITPVELVTELGCEIEITGKYRSFSLSRRMIFFFFKENDFKRQQSDS